MYQGIQFEGHEINNFLQSASREWLETNGIGGYSSGTVSGANSRKYHGLLVAAMHPPVGRMVLLSKLVETVITENASYELDCNQFYGDVHPKGFQYLSGFKKGLFNEFTFQTGNIELVKTVFMPHGENTTIIRYEVKKADGDVTLKLKPFLAYRDYHGIMRANDGINKGFHFDGDTLKLHPYNGTPELLITVPGAIFAPQPDWYKGYIYAGERDRGMECEEDLFTHGEFYVRLKKGDVLSVVATVEAGKAKDTEKLFSAEKKRREKLISSLKVQDEFASTLALAADQFVVKRGKDQKTIIAGYHWFSDWGRDTMISLPGLCLSTGRFEDAKKILQAFGKYVDQGMIPNRFPDVGEEPEYNTVDATLWYIVAAYQYFKKTNDKAFIVKELFPLFEDVISWHLKGTRYGIKADTDGLLNAGEEGVQLTWMDAKIGDWVVTPREGKAVEINALWFNALMIMQEFAKLAGKEEKPYKDKATQVQKSFNKEFLNDISGTLYDVVRGLYKDSSVRPNQLFAISLPFELVNKKIAKAILKEVEELLLTPVGLRSLSPKNYHYKAYYAGDGLARDSAYHQGTVWSWLMGPYMSAKIKIDGEAGKEEVRKLLKGFEKHLTEAGVGSVSEIFDGTEPFFPKGCIAQAWGVAEALRVYLDELN
jgi:predicted glycogen debranching enzyme